MTDLKFGAFLAPHHPIGEHPTLQFQNDIRLAKLLDELGYDEFWCGEHHSTGWEMIASPELFLAAVAEHTAGGSSSVRASYPCLTTIRSWSPSDSSSSITSPAGG